MKPYHLLLFLFALLAGCSLQQKLSCAYVPVETENNKYPELTQFDNCGSLSNKSLIFLHKNHFDTIWFNGDGLAEIRIYDGIYYLNKQGKLVRTHLYDNGADYFQKGKARTIKNNSYGFINKSLNVVIAPKYDFAFPFSNGRAKVCMNCRKKNSGDHIELVDGVWGYIDNQGAEIVPVIHSEAEIDKLGQSY